MTSLTVQFTSEEAIITFSQRLAELQYAGPEGSYKEAQLEIAAKKIADNIRAHDGLAMFEAEPGSPDARTELEEAANTLLEMPRGGFTSVEG